MDVLRIQNLRRVSAASPLKNASFSVGEGEVVALLGDNGAEIHLDQGDFRRSPG